VISGNHSREVYERAGKRRAREIVDASDLVRRKGGAVDADAGDGRALAVDRYIRFAVVGWSDAMQTGRVAMAEHGAGADSKDCCESGAARAQSAMADGVDASVQPYEVATVQAAAHHLPRHAHTDELRPAHHTVLAICQVCHGAIPSSGRKWLLGNQFLPLLKSGTAHRPTVPRTSA
jgi:hypothetical protein